MIRQAFIRLQNITSIKGCLKAILVVCFIMSTNVALLFAQKEDSLAIADTANENKNVFKALPLAYYTPETSVAFEGFAFYSFYSKGAEKKSNVRLFATYTLNDQYMFILPWQVYTSDQIYFIDGSLDFRGFPEYFYGLGNETNANERELYDFTALTFDNKAYRRISEDIYFGLDLQFQQLVPTFPESSTLFAEIADEASGFWYTRFGPSIMWDQRDHILCPMQGKFFEVTFNTGLGKRLDEGNYRFSMLTFDYRNYHKLNDKATWAHQFYAQFTMGDLPFRLLPTLGGPYMHRGYYMGRFRGRQLLLYQSEYRRHIKGRFGMTLFASAGRVYNKLERNVIDNIHPSVGAGLRLRVSKDDKTNVRFDVALTPDSHGFYIYFAEAF